MKPYAPSSFALLAILLAAPAARAGDPLVIYTEIPGHATATVPGAKDAAGNPAFAEFIALEDLAVREDGNQWVLKARTGQGTTLDSILMRGAGFVGTAFAQDGQPFLGGVAGELYDFFDTPIPAAWDDAGNMAFSARARGGVASVFEKVVVVDAFTSTHTIVIQMGDAALGLVDNPVGSSGDETFGNSINAVHLFNSGIVGFVNTPITNCHSSRYPAHFRGNTSFRQSGVSPIGGEIWDNFGLSDSGATPDGAHWFSEGDTENANTAIDEILVVDDAIVLQEGSPVAGTGPVMVDVFFTRMLSDGTWFSRGDATGGDDWAVRNGVLLAKTGDAISATENWGAAFSTFTGNQAGDWLLAGNTTNPDPDRDTVIVLNGTTVIAREGDPIDLDANGFFDDDVFINSFQATDLFITDERLILLLATLRNGAGTLLGDAFLRYAVHTGPGESYCFGDGSLATPCPCANTGVTGHGCDNSTGTGGAQISAAGATSPDSVVLTASGELPTVLSIFLQGDVDASAGITFGDGVRCVNGALKRLYVKNASGGVVSAPGFGDLSITDRSAALGDPLSPGDTRYYQVYSRDPDLSFCAAPPGNSWNVSNGRAITW